MSQALQVVQTVNLQQTVLLKILQELLRQWQMSKLPYGIILGFALQSQCEFVRHQYVDITGRSTVYLMPKQNPDEAHVFEQMVKTGPSEVFNVPISRHTELHVSVHI